MEIERIWEAYNNERGKLGRLQSTSMVSAYAYLLGFHLPNVVRTEMVLDRAFNQRNFDFTRFKNHGATIIDLGVGSGAVVSATLNFLTGSCGFNHKDIRAEIVDRSGSFLDIAKLIIADQMDPKAVKSHKKEILEYDIVRSLNVNTAKDQLRIVTVGYVWNEVNRNKKSRSHFAGQLAKLASAPVPVVLMLLDSSNESQARDIMELRDEVVSAGMRSVYPCPSDKACPMLKDERDWCYSEAKWNQPAVMKRLDRLLDVNRSRFATSGYLFCNPTAAAAMKALPKSDTSVIVGRPKTGSGPSTEFQYLICEAGRLTKRPGDQRNLPRGLQFIGSRK